MTRCFRRDTNQWRKMPVKTAAVFLRAFDKIEAGDDHGLDLKKLSGREGFRLCIGQYRAIYTHETEVIVIDAGPRGDIYR
jgi:mRNA interferase RelE/StbE